jgi:hypothetical protein
MPRRISTPKLDTVQNARRVVLASVGEVSATPVAAPYAPPDAVIISRIMAEMGRKGGRIGGKRRLVTMTSAERSDVASAAAKARWKAVKKKAKAGAPKPKLH